MEVDAIVTHLITPSDDYRRRFPRGIMPPDKDSNALGGPGNKSGYISSLTSTQTYSFEMNGI